MKLDNDLEIVDGLPILYVRRLDAIVCSDLHLGYEGVMAERGYLLPKVNLKRIKRVIKQASEKTSATRMIIAGDIKNEFGKVHFEEYNEFRDLVDFVRLELGINAVTLVKGNHDNFVDRIRPGLGIEIFQSEALLEGILFFHGDGMPQTKGFGAMVMGHVHPAITLQTYIGVREKLHCFLYGKSRGGANVVVLPALNYFAQGVGVNMEDIGEMAPVFRSMINADSMRAIAVSDGETLDFGTIGQLRSLGEQ